MSEICPICSSALINEFDSQGSFYSCINRDCQYGRRITKQNQVQILTNKVNCFVEGKFISENYEVHISESEVREGRTILEIHADKTTTGVWKWYLSDLMHLGKYSNGRIVSDTLSLDWGNDWYVTGMLKVYREIVNSIVLKGISI